MSDVVLLGYRDMMPEGCVFITRAEVPPIPAAADRWREDVNDTVVYDDGQHRWRVCGDRLLVFIDYGGGRVAGRPRQWKRLWCEEGDNAHG